MNRKTVAVVLLGISLLFVIFSAGCVEEARESKAVGNTKIVVPMDYGNGVYYFDCVGAEFANSISSFIETHPNLELVSTAGDGRGGYGMETGYFAFFREKIVNS